MLPERVHNARCAFRLNQEERKQKHLCRKTIQERAKLVVLMIRTCNSMLCLRLYC